MSMGWLYRPSHLAPGTLHSFGYAGGEDAQARLDALMENAATFLLDIRYRPVSRWRPQWNRAALAERYGRRYTWVQALGNVNYAHRTWPIRLAEGHPQAIQAAAQLVASGLSLVLLCACKNERRCHRALVLCSMTVCLCGERAWWLVSLGHDDEAGVLAWGREIRRAATTLGLDPSSVLACVQHRPAVFSSHQADVQQNAKETS